MDLRLSAAQKSWQCEFRTVWPFSRDPGANLRQARSLFTAQNILRRLLPLYPRCLMGRRVLARWPLPYFRDLPCPIYSFAAQVSWQASRMRLRDPCARRGRKDGRLLLEPGRGFAGREEGRLGRGSHRRVCGRQGACKTAGS